MADDLFRDLFRNRRVFVTGHTGFKGSWLSAWLTLLGAKVTGFALEPESDVSHFNLLNPGARIHHIRGDIREYEHLRTAIEEARPEFVFHLAAQPIVRLSYREPKATFDTNVGGSVNLLEALRGSNSVRVLIFVTSDKCYENRELVWGYREEDRLGGRDPYSASKACAELVLAAYRAVLPATLRAASVRAGNIIGGGDWAQDRIVPDCIRALRARRAVEVRSPQSTRPWQHVLEPLGGYLLLASRLYSQGDRYAGAWNFGPANEAHHTVAELVYRIIGAWGAGEWRNVSNGDGLHESRLLGLNCDKALRELEWRPVWGFKEAVDRTVDWYKRWADGEDVWRLTAGQIHDYMRESKREKTHLNDPRGNYYTAQADSR